MSSTYIPAALRRLVEERANYRCEYCLFPHNVSFFPHEIDHVIPEKHGGKTDAIAKLPVHHCIIGLIPFSVRQA